MALAQRTHPAGALADDSALAARIAGRDHAAFEALMRRHNGRLFRVARAILKDDAEAEDALQDAYVDAYRHIDGYEGRSPLGAWLTRIVVNRSLMRLRTQRRERVVLPFRAPGSAAADDDAAADMQIPDESAESAQDGLLRAELRQLLERRIDELPVAFRTVFVLREVESLTVDETADALSIPPATVRTRLFRARALLRERLARDIDQAAVDLFGFDGERCDRIVELVLARVGHWAPV